MCGRAAQTVHIAHVAAMKFGARTDHGYPNRENASDKTPSKHSCNSSGSYESLSEQEGNVSFSAQYDNYNMSPGMDASLIWLENGEMKVGRKVWGLVTKGGSKQNPLPSDKKSRMGMHFSSLMYNARTDTLFSKPTFSRLTAQGKSCIVALDGYFEWKTSPLGGGKGKKQPYFVYRNKPKGATHADDSLPCLLLAGLWNRVPTGLEEEPYLETFCILTTEPNEQIRWLHNRMPVCLWGGNASSLAREWLESPTSSVLRKLESSSKQYTDVFGWHMVSTQMSSMKFRGKEAIAEKKGPASVASFFTKQSPSPTKKNGKKSEKEPASKSNVEAGPSTSKAPAAKRREHPFATLPPPKKLKAKKETSRMKGQITSFFKNQC